MRPLVVVMTEGARSFARRKLRGAQGSLDAAQAMLAHTLETAALVGDVRVCAPTEGDAVGLPWLRQGTGSLGARVSSSLRRLLETESANPARPVLLIGDDCPGLTLALLAEAAHALEGGARAVVGRAKDGGFWLVGLASLELTTIDALEARVAWSTPQAAVTLESFLSGTFGEPPALVTEQCDLDEPADLRLAVRAAVSPELRARLAAVRHDAGGEPAEPRAFAPIAVRLAGNVALPRPPPRG